MHSIKTVQESLKCAKQFSEATFGIAYPIPHTYLYDYIQKNDYFLKEPIPIKHKGETIDWIMFDLRNFQFMIV